MNGPYIHYFINSNQAARIIQENGAAGVCPEQMFTRAIEFKKQPVSGAIIL